MLKAGPQFSSWCPRLHSPSSSVPRAAGHPAVNSRKRSRESVVASGNRSVGSKDSVPGDLLAGILERAPGRDKLAHPLEDGESCVTLVHVVGGRVDTDAAQRRTPPTPRKSSWTMRVRKSPP